MKKREYVNGKSLGDTIILFYRAGLQTLEERISAYTSPWYFCVLMSDFLKHKETFSLLKDAGLVRSYMKDDNDTYIKVYCENRNISFYRRDEQSDDKAEILQELASKGIQTFEADVQSHQRYMIDNDIKIAKDYYKGYFDIETKDTGERIVHGAEPILSIAVVDDMGKEFYWSSNNERAMLTKALAKLSEFTMLIGWNSSAGKGAFDIPYIKARCDRLEIKYPLWDVGLFDMFDWFQKAVGSGRIREDLENLKLDTVAQHFLGGGKTEGVKAGHGRIWGLFCNDKPKLKEYNLQDCKMVLGIDNVLNITKEFIEQCRLCGTFISRSSNTSLTDMKLLRLARKEGRRLVTKKDIHTAPFKIPGGRVYRKRGGVFEKVKAFDFKGYYATIMQSFNISPDTFLDLPALRSLDDDVPVVLSVYTWLNAKLIRQLHKMLKRKGIKCQLISETVHGFDIPRLRVGAMVEHINPLIGLQWKRFRKNYTLSLEQFKPMFYNIKHRTSKKGTKYLTINMPYPAFFRRDFVGVVPLAITEYTDCRNDVKELIATLKEQGVDAKDPRRVNADVMSATYKLLCNMIFGQTGCLYSRLFNPAIAPSITLAAQTCTLYTSRWFNERGYPVIYMDTDSNYVESDTTRHDDELVQRYIDEYPGYIRNKLVPEFNLDGSAFTVELEFEKIFERLLIRSKKRYAAIQVWKEGKYDRKRVVVGLDTIRRDIPNYTKKLQEKVLDKILEGDISEGFGERLFAWMSRVRKRFFASDWTKPKNIERLVIRKIANKAPETYKTKNVLATVLNKMFARGEFFEYGNTLPYVLLECESGTDAEEASHYLKTASDPEQQSLALEYYWNKQVYSKAIMLLELVFDKINWYALDTKLGPASEKRFNQLKKWGLTRKVNRDGTYKSIFTYKNFNIGQREELINAFIEGEEKLIGSDSDMLERAKSDLEILDVLLDKDEG